MDGERLTDELRRGSQLAGERLPTPEQCAGQRGDYEQFAREELHVSHAVDRVMALIQQRVRQRQLRLKLRGCGERMQAVAALAGPLGTRKEPIHGEPTVAEVPRSREPAARDAAGPHV